MKTLLTILMLSLSAQAATPDAQNPQSSTAKCSARTAYLDTRATNAEPAFQETSWKGQLIEWQNDDVKYTLALFERGQGLQTRIQQSRNTFVSVSESKQKVEIQSRRFDVNDQNQVEIVNGQSELTRTWLDQNHATDDFAQSTPDERQTGTWEGREDGSQIVTSLESLTNKKVDDFQVLSRLSTCVYTPTPIGKMNLTVQAQKVVEKFNQAFVETPATRDEIWSHLVTTEFVESLDRASSPEQPQARPSQNSDSDALEIPPRRHWPCVNQDQIDRAVRRGLIPPRCVPVPHRERCTWVRGRRVCVRD